MDLEVEPHAQAILDVMLGPSRDESWWGRRRDLRFLLFKFTAAESTHPQDKIIALLSISTDTDQESIFVPDCSKSLSTVLKETASFLLFGTVLPISD